MTTEEIEEMVKDGGAVYENTVQEKKLLLELAYKIYEAGKHKDDGMFFDTRREMLITVYKIQSKSLTTLTTKHQEEVEERVREERERAVRWTLNNFEVMSKEDWGTKTFGEYAVEKAHTALTPTKTDKQTEHLLNNKQK